MSQHMQQFITFVSPGASFPGGTMLLALGVAVLGCEGSVANHASFGFDAGAGVDSGLRLDAGTGTDAGVSTSDWVTYLGGNADEQVRDVAVDAAGNIYVGGKSDASIGADYSYGSLGGTSDTLVAKYRPDGSLVFKALVGGPNHDRAYAIEVDDTGIYIGGRAGAGMPVSAGVVQPGFAGDREENARYGKQDGFLAKLSLDGSRLIWLTYLGGPGREIIRDIAIDPAGNVYASFIEVRVPVQFITANAFDQTIEGVEGVLAKVQPDGRGLVYATYVGGSGDERGASSVRADRSGNAYFAMSTESDDAPVSSNAAQQNRAGQTDFFVIKVSPNGNNLLWGTYFGGSSTEGGETHNLAINPAGEAFITAHTGSSDLPTTSGAYRESGRQTGFVARISANGRRIVAATYLPHGESQGIDIDAAGRVLVTGGGNTGGLATTDGFQPSLGGGVFDGYAVVLSGDLTRSVYATYLGGDGDDRFRGVVAGPNNRLYAVGQTTSRNLPVTNGAAQSKMANPFDGMVAQFAY